MSATAPSARDVAQNRWNARSILERLESPVAPYYLILGATGFLLLFGLVMVLSASSITSYQDSGSSFTVVKNQATFAVLGVIAAVIASRLSVATWKKLAVPAFVAAIFLEALVFTPLGRTVLGNRNWIGIGGFTMQPSELGKLGVVLIGATILATKRRHIGDWKKSVLPFVAACSVMLVLIMAGHDLGTSMVIAAIAGAMLWVAGVRGRVFAVMGAVLVMLMGVAVLSSGNRTGRLDAWLGTCINAQTDGCYQKMHGMYALADGGWWGVGLGASREKWGLLPEAHNDFIFAIIGEELGLPGTLTIVALYAVLAYACYRLIATSKDFFVRMATAGVMTWILVQAMINIGSVTGLLPIIGVPLPMVSTGGSALVTTLLALGMLLSFARNEPACAKALAARPSLARRTAAIFPTKDSSK